MSQSTMNLTQALDILSTGELLSQDLARQTFFEINRVLRAEDTAIDWDDAWDAIELLNNQHSAGLPFLIYMLQDEGNSSLRDNYTRIWATRAITKIGGDSDDVVLALSALLEDSNCDVRGEAATALRKCDRGEVVKRRWIDRFLRRKV